MEAPRENLYRGMHEKSGRSPRLLVPAESRDDTAGTDGRTMYGHFTVFDQWSEIDSVFEGRFLERIAPGAFKKTFRERGDQVKIMYNHGSSFGGDPVAVASLLREKDFGPYFEARLLDTRDVNETLLPLLRSDPPVLGASFMFNVTQESWDDDVERSDHNPLGLPERTITEVRLHEFGPVVWPAYEAATAKVRSLTDHFSTTSTSDGPAGEDHREQEAATPTEEAAPDEHFSGSTPAQLRTRLLLLSS